MAGDSESGDIEESETKLESNKVKNFDQAEEVEGKLRHSEAYDKLMHSVLENDKDTIEQGQMIQDGMDHGLQSFTPDMMFEQFVNNYKNAKQLYGERLIRELSGYDESYVEKNIRIPEFQRELKERLRQSVKSLKDQGLLGKEGEITDEGIVVATMSMVREELDRMKKKGVFGERANRTKSLTGEKADYREYVSTDRYRDIAVKASAKKAIRRGHRHIGKEDLVVHDHVHTERATIIYAIDASGSMRGEKIAAAKRAGIALAYKAIKKRDKVGCVVFGKEVVSEHAPTQDFMPLVRTMLRARAAKETDIAQTIHHAITMFDSQKGVKHLLLLTDGLHTASGNKQVLEAASTAYRADITLSIVGLSLDEDGEQLCKQIVDIGRGSLYVVKNYEDLDMVFIEEYYRVRQR